MAETDETFDPNDLDSIDALLDEAEADTAVDGIEPEGDVESSDVDQDSLDELLEEAEDVSESDLEIEDSAEKEGVDLPDTSLATDDGDRRKVQAGKDSKDEAVPDADDFLARRAKSNNNSNMAAKDMDAIKKQVTIFGAALIVLVLVGIGIGVWSVIAAKGSAMDEETFTIIESNLVRSELNGKGIAEAGSLLKSLDKKLDALSFQLEGLVADVAKIEEQSQKQVSSMMPGALNVEHKPASTDVKEGAVKTAADGHTKTAAVQMNYATSDPRLLDKVTSVNSKVITAQRRIDEVNRRVKSIQQQHKTLLHSVKTVEKQIIMQQVAMEEKEKEKEAKKNEYPYGTPDGMFYDQSVGDSYP